VDQEQAVSLIARTHLFAGLDRTALAVIAAEGHERTYKRREAIFHQGEHGDSFYVVVDGAVKVIVTSTQGEEEMVLTTVRSPDTVGDVALFDEGPRSASAEALEPVRLLAFAPSTVLGLAERDPRIYESLLRVSVDVPESRLAGFSQEVDTPDSWVFREIRGCRRAGLVASQTWHRTSPQAPMSMRS
jgi:signal-transduction protein with cAMP-binding, CBS, and nucleotidyltransferase domain